MLANKPGSWGRNRLQHRGYLKVNPWCPVLRPHETIRKPDMNPKDASTSKFAEQLSRLKAENTRLREENERLRGMLGLSLHTKHAAPKAVRLFQEDKALPEVNERSSPAEKIKLFRALFRGRDDIYARYWSDENTGKKGYSPATADHLKKRSGPKTYLPLTDEVLYGHLSGKHVIGLYPLLPDDGCFLLACDFDGATWAPDALGFLNAAERWKVPAYLERSRSGQGGHAWIFFTRPVPAVAARRLGTNLLRETMVARGEMELASYDRLFPNQDFMPKGGFGNLIALPLQKKARARGNTEFVDGGLRPWHDPWLGLSKVRRMTPEELESLLEELPPLTIGFESGAFETRKRDSIDQEAPPPQKIRCVRGAQLSLERSGLPPSLSAHIKHLASLHNPEYYKRQKLRLSVHGTPRLVRCYEEDLAHIHLPRGILDGLKSAVGDAGSRLELEDKRIAPDRLSLKLREPLRKAQKEAVRELLRHDEGVLVAPPGSGKTRMACAILAKRKTPALVLVHRKPLIDQWRLELQSCLGLTNKEIGQWDGHRRRRSRIVDLAMIQSLRSSESWRILNEYGQIIVDECHHIPAVSFESIIQKAPARFVLGLTATPYRRDGLGDLIKMRCGPVRHRFTDTAGGDSYERRLVVQKTEFDPEPGEAAQIQEIYQRLVNDRERNRLVCRDVKKAILEGAHPVVLTEWREHLVQLDEELQSMDVNAAILHGGLKKKERQARVAELQKGSQGNPTLVLATGALVGEGFDLPNLDALFLTFPISFKGKVIQYVGRILRSHPGKTKVTVYDYDDHLVPVLTRMQSRREKTLHSVGFSVHANNKLIGLHSNVR